MTARISEETRIRDLIVATGKSMFDRGLTGGSTGNISVRLDDGSTLMTPTNASLGVLDPERLSLIDPAGSHVSGDRPTKEAFLHHCMYRARGGDRAVHVGIARLGRAGDHFLAVRIDDFELPPARRGDPFAADEQLVGMLDVHAFGGHSVSPRLIGRHCERSEAIQGRTAEPWIAASPSAPRNDENRASEIGQYGEAARIQRLALAFQLKLASTQSGLLVDQEGMDRLRLIGRQQIVPAGHAVG